MKTEFATFGGGCFWGVEKYLQEIPGVIDAVSGYAGGYTENPTYLEVCRGVTGHAEVVNVEFDPSKIDFEKLVTQFLKTYREVNENNLSTNSQYRSIVFYRDENQKKAIETAFEKYSKESGKKITTQINKFEKFFEAEPYHQDYYGVCKTEI